MSPEATPRPVLKDSTVLVTGASRGIGRVIAETLHRDGARVIIHYGASREHAEALASQFGDAGFGVQADLATHNGARSLWESAEQ